MKGRGAWIRACAATLFDVRTIERIVDPAIADLQHESFSVSRYLAVLKVVVLCAGGAGMRRAMKCSFCRRPDSQVEKLVAGPWRLLAGRVYICDRCAAQTIEIMQSHTGDTGPGAPAGSQLRRVLNRIGWFRHPEQQCATADALRN